MRSAVTIAALVSLGVPAHPMEEKIFRWLEVVPVRRSFDFPDAPKAMAGMEIHGPSGDPLYRLQCYGSQADRSRSDPHPNDLYSGEFDCHLYPLTDGSGVRTLLLDEMAPDGEQYGRAAMVSTDVLGRCADYPEYGRVRHFRLRGMRITFQYFDVKVQEQFTSSEPKVKLPVLRAFRFTFDVARDPTAVSAIAEPVRFASPPPKKTENPNVILANCQTVIPRHVPGVVTESYTRSHGLEPPYPKIRPVETEKTFTGRQPNSLRLPIPDETGKTAYDVVCTAAVGEAGLDEWAVRCKLQAASSDFDLLADAVDPYSRMSPALLIPDQIYHACSQYPEWGSRRTFRLRGLRLTLELKNASFARIPPNYPPGFVVPQYLLETVNLRVSAQLDPAASSPVALPPKYIYWGILDGFEACETVLVNSGSLQPR